MSIDLQVSTKGAVSFYGLNRFPFTLYRDEWKAVFEARNVILSFIARCHLELSCRCREDVRLELRLASQRGDRLRDEDAIGLYRNLRGLGCEIQVCSQLAHIYHELEHDVRYKPLSGDLSKTENDLLNALARLMEVGDTIINQTRDAASARQKERSAEFQERRESVARIRDNRPLNLAGSPLLLDLANLVQASRPDHDLPETPAALFQEMMRLLAAGALRTGSLTSGAQLLADELLDLQPRRWCKYL